MTNQRSIQVGRYLYCIIQTDEDKSFGETLSDPGGIIRTVRNKDLAAVVSDALVRDYPVTREASLAHQRVIERVMKGGHTVLPVKFSTIAEDEAEIIRQVLQAREEELKGLIKKMQGKREIGLKCSWTDMPALFDSIVKENQAIHLLKEELARRSEKERYFDRIELGKMVQAALEERKEREGKQIVSTLAKVACDTRQNFPYGDPVFLNAAFLVEEAKEEAFFKEVSRLQDKSKGAVRFKTIVGAPPFNFVNIVIHWDREPNPEKKEGAAHVSSR